jgi:hypothetical protein
VGGFFYSQVLLGEFMSDSMVYFLSAMLALLSVVGFFIWKFRKPRQNNPVELAADLSVVLSPDVSPEDSILTSTDLEPFLKFQALDRMDYAVANLSEVTDSNLISRLDSVLVPAVEMAAKALSPNLKDAYRVIVPPGAELEKSRQIKGAFRAFFRDGKRIAGQANLEKLDPTKAAAIANVATNAMNVAALVVGQQFMAEISSKLDSINGKLDAIADRLDADLRSTVQSELVLISEISKFRSEIMEHPEERNRRLISLDAHKRSVAHALGKVNILIDQEAARFDGRQGSKGVKAYQEVVHRLQVLAQQQEILVALLGEISNLTYILGVGEISLEASSTVFKGYLSSSTIVRDRLGEWHAKQIETLKIDLDGDRAQKGLFEGLPGLIVERWKYVSTDPGLETEIENQGRLESAVNSQIAEAFDKDVELIMKDGKYYYLRSDSQ